MRVSALEVDLAAVLPVKERMMDGIVETVLIVRHDFLGSKPRTCRLRRLGIPDFAQERRPTRLRGDHDPVLAKLVPTHRAAMQQYALACIGLDIYRQETSLFGR